MFFLSIISEILISKPNGNPIRDPKTGPQEYPTTLPDISQTYEYFINPLFCQDYTLVTDTLHGISPQSYRYLSILIIGTISDCLVG